MSPPADNRHMGKPRLPAAIRRLKREERGISLFEVTLAIFIFTFVLVGLLSLLDTSAKMAPKDDERAKAIREAQVGLDGMVRELRQAYAVVGTSPQSMQVLVRIAKDDPSTQAVEDHVNRYVEYDCGVANPGKCERREAPIGGVLPADGRTVIDRVLNSFQTGSRAPFTYSAPSGLGFNNVQVHIEVPAAGERGTKGYRHTVVLEDGFDLRNLPHS